MILVDALEQQLAASSSSADKSLGQWFLRKGHARWVPGQPPVFRLQPLGPNEFRVLPELLPDSLPCRTEVSEAEWEDFQKALPVAQACPNEALHHRRTRHRPLTAQAWVRRRLRTF